MSHAHFFSDRKYFLDIQKTSNKITTGLDNTLFYRCSHYFIKISCFDTTNGDDMLFVVLGAN